jgi:serine/threonine protein kinase
MRHVIIGAGEEFRLTFLHMAPEDKPRGASPPADPGRTVLDPTRLTSKGEFTGEVLNGRYVIQNELKRGGMGVVYLARDQQLHSRPVVVKVLLDEAYHSEYVVQKFRQEVEALSRIDHPGIVGIIDAGELPNGRPFIIMQYVEGVTLRSVLSAEGMNLERSGELLKQIGRALTAAHNCGIFHRDLKPDNIMLQDLGHGEEQVKIIDFGIAKVKDSVIAPSTSLNLSPGTVAYMAPEQLNGRPITAATDIFALGTIAYEMVTGRKPFNPETGFELLQMQQTGVRIKPADLRPSLPLDAQEVILRALSYNPGDRFNSPKDFGDQLARALSQEVEHIESPSKPSLDLPATQLSNEETPVAQSPAAASPKTIQVPFQPAQPVSTPSHPGFPEQPAGARRSRSKLIPLLAVAGLLIVVASVAIWYVTRSRTGKTEGKGPETPSAAERNLSYGLTVQKMRSNRPYQEPFESSGQEIFENGWKFRMNVTSPQEGYLYLLNEGPAAGDEITYNMLFPEAKTNGGSARVAADQKLQTAWMRFDDHQGTEKFWIVWAAAPVKDLDAVTDAVNDQDRGEIKDSAKLRRVRDFLAQHSSPKPEVAKDSAKKQTTIKRKGDTLVSFIELEHH